MEEKMSEIRDNLCLFLCFQGRMLDILCLVAEKCYVHVAQNQIQVQPEKVSTRAHRKNENKLYPVMMTEWSKSSMVLTHFSLANMPPYQRTHFPFLWFVFWCLLLVLVLSRHMFVCTCERKTEYFNVCKPPKIKNLPMKSASGTNHFIIGKHKPAALFADSRSEAGILRSVPTRPVSQTMTNQCNDGTEKWHSLLIRWYLLAQVVPKVF